ncbi:hypothetical protein [Kribbella sp. HUAS MG21]|uniref:DNA ligase D 3'-phosphoesterase domain-containing protein n=1 Tax=Kribbella sp. HUAS MG21 TaxID=3160966 RepID=A0AAU7T5M1_9ACTN
MRKLQEYERKRDLRRTPEPRGRRGRRSARSPRFVVQKHDASSLHYDFRLEADGLRTGHVKVWLDGEKLTGGYALTRVGKGERSRWMLVKMDDEGADRRRKPVKTQPESVVSGRTVEQVAEEAR